MRQSKLSHHFTGMGVVSAAGWGLPATTARIFESVKEDASLIDALESRFLKLAPRHNPAGGPSFLPNFFALSAVEEALTEAQLSRHQLKQMRVGVCFGSTVGCTNFQEEFGESYFSGWFPDPAPWEGYESNNTAQFIARRFDCRGPVLMVSNACTSGADAIGVGASWLDQDLCDLVICGGTETVLPRIFYGFRSLMLCSPVRCKPFDRKRLGLTLGEGAGALILEKSSTARSSRGVFLGYGCGSDAYHPTSPHPEGRGLDLAVRLSLEKSALNIGDVDFINAHGTGTPHNDLTEGKWVARHASHTRLAATKGYTGHTLGAAGAIEAILTLLSLQRQQLPASVGFDEVDPDIGLEPTRTVEEGDFNTALSLSLGFGGLNSALCLGRST